MNTRWDRLAPLLGVGFLVLLVISFAIGGNEPQGGASAAKVLSWYGSHRSRVQAAAYLLVATVAVAFFFYGYLRDRLAGGSPGLAATAFGGVILFAVGGTIGAGMQLALAEHSSKLGSGAALALSELFLYGNWIALNAGTAVLLLAFGIAILRAGRLPAWTGWLAVGFGLLSVVPVYGIDPIPVAVWTLVISVVLFRRESRAAVAGRSGVAQPAATTAG
ncbi:MAG: hypothetical protein JO130_01130 [Solirubrobacterales bacterium]|nr:hypothetical protein [Solirubrobacterales bacterium]